jgi:tRNA (cmo5U34)-methyltransferase
MPINNAFDDTVEYYDDWMRKALPNFEDIYQTAEELVFFDPAKPIDVLDLGAGTGLFSARILEKYPSAKFVLYDLAEGMLDVAKKRFQKAQSRFEFIIGDYRRLLVTREFDLVISSLSIHHLADREKADLFRSVYGILRSPGIFINIDQIRGETEFLRNVYWDHWLRQVKKAEPVEERIRQSIDRRKTYDQDASLGDQLRWLAGAGFKNVDCVYKNFFVGVFFAVKE